MEFQRGDVVLIPFPYTDFSAAKTRPAVVISSELYHLLRQELLLAYVSSQVSQANPAIDHVLVITYPLSLRGGNSRRSNLPTGLEIASPPSAARNDAGGR